MTQRKTPEDYHALAAQHGLAWLGPEVKTIIALTRWRCPQGHEWEMRYGNIYMGQGCPRCGITRRKEMARYRPKDYHELARQKGFVWLGPEVQYTREFTGWRCQNGHEWQAKYNTIRDARWGCPHCAGVVPKTAEDFHALAQKKGFKWLGSKVINTNTPTQWQCARGHVWDAPYKSLRNGNGCPHCAIKQDDDYHSMAADRGLLWLGPKPGDVMKKTNWRCTRCGYNWNAPYGSLQGGSSCPQCAADNLRKQPNDYHAVATAAGLTWLGPAVENSKTKTSWQCGRGHVWRTDYDSIRSGRGCPVCKGIAVGDRLRLKPEDYKILALERELIWLGPEVENNSAKTRWECLYGHIWLTNYTTIQGGSNCPECQNRVNGSRVSKLQVDLCHMVGGEPNVAFDKYWLDIVIERDGIKIDVEYDGWYWHQDKLEDDARRDKFLIAAGWHILRVRSGGLLPTPQQMETAVSRLIRGETWTEIVLADWLQKGATTL